VLRATSSFRYRVTAAVGGKPQRVMCVRACPNSFRLPSPRAVIDYIYISSKIAIILASAVLSVVEFLCKGRGSAF